MAETSYRSRRAVRIENDQIRLTVLVEGGHIAEFTDQASGVNPLWTPPWPSIEPSAWDPARTPAYGSDAESRLLAGIMGHNLCLDLFGGPSPEEHAAGISVHGEASVLPYEIESAGGALTARLRLPASQLAFERRIRLEGRIARFTETVENLSAWDRPIAWTQHVTLGPPFVVPGETEFRAPATLSKVVESDFTGGMGYMETGAEFVWPFVPHKDGGTVDMRVFPALEVSAAFSTHLMDADGGHAFFLAWSPETKTLFGYVWDSTDFPWLGIWEENRCRAHHPWNGNTITRGMEFGASPFPETRRAMIERGSLFGEAGYRWIAARSSATVRYSAFIDTADSIPDQPHIAASNS
ncbi:MAG: hypothetical protein HY822_17605 [Acidobacteria bacterium]|nr:hypothetical protein [Acidobacteriota bacterium]